MKGECSVISWTTHEIQFPLWKFFYVKAGVDIRLEALLDRGYSLRVSLEVDAEGARWAGVPIPWLGKLTSGDLRFAKGFVSRICG